MARLEVHDHLAVFEHDRVVLFVRNILFFGDFLRPIENPGETITALRVTTLFRVTMLSPTFDRDVYKAPRRPRPDRYAFRRRAILFQ
jgi:hypothetical protein